MTLIIRRAVPSDAPTIAAHNASLAAETEGVHLDPERLLQGIQAIIEDDSKGFYLVADSGGSVVGQLMVTFEWSDWRNGTFWWLQSVYVHPEHRRRGIFRLLYQTLLEKAQGLGDVCGLRLYVERENMQAQQTYQRLGLSPTHYHVYEVDFVLRR